MLEFSEDYFKEEVRCDFTISEKMKRAWAAEMEVLSEIIRVCKKYEITYYANWGTLLGAIRHQGYIPWDDDLDISLKRKDYRKLLKVLPDELPESYHVSSLYTPGDHSQPISCVMNSKVILTDQEMIKKFHGCPFIAGVDIDPLDYIPKDKELAETQRVLYNVVYDAAHRYEELEQSGELEQFLPKIEEFCKFSFDKSKPLKKQLWILSDTICSLYGETESDYLTWFPRTIRGNKNFRFPKEWFAYTIEMPFENMQIAVPNGYDQILTLLYGDYKIPMRDSRGAHDYPFYKKQEEFLERLKKQQME